MQHVGNVHGGIVFPQTYGTAPPMTGQVVSQYGEVLPELFFTICEHR